MTGFRTISSDRLIDGEKIDNLPLDLNAELLLKADKSDTYTKAEINSSLSAKQNTLISGTNIKTINGNSLLGGGDIVIEGGGVVDSVNGQVGDIVLTQDNILDGTTYKQFSQTEKTKLSGIETGAEVNNISDVNATDLTDGGDTTLHTHDSRYYTESEVNSLLTGKQDTSTLQETVEDIIGTKVKAGTNVTVSYNDTTGETTISSTGGGGGGGGDMYKAVYDPANGAKQVAFKDEVVPYTGATTDVDLDTHILSAKSIQIKGTGGTGHLALKHQSAGITASTSESALGANSSGNPVWKNDGNALQSIMLENSAITGATKTKITYDAKGLVTGGTDATTADIADSLNKRYVTDANLVVIGNTSGTNTGDNAPNTNSGLLHTTGDETASGNKTFTGNIASNSINCDNVTEATGIGYASGGTTFPLSFITRAINSTPLSVTGASAFSYYAGFYSPRVAITGGTTSQQIVGVYSLPQITSSATNSAFTLNAFSAIAYRTYANDTSTSSANTINGANFAVGHSSSLLPDTAVTGIANGCQFIVQLGTGTINIVRGANFNLALAGTNGRTTASTTVEGSRVLMNLGTTAGATYSATDVFGYKLECGFGASSGTTTITNFYGMKLFKPTYNTSATVTNRWGIYQEDDTAKNYFGAIQTGFGVTSPTATLHLRAGTATANTAPLKFTSGTALTTPEDGAVEYHSSHLYFTIGSTRHQLDQQGGGNIEATKSTFIAGENITAGNALCLVNSLEISTYKNATGSNGLFGSSTRHKYAGSFTYNGNINKISIRVAKSGSPIDNIVLRIETDNAGSPSGTLVDVNATQSIVGSSLPSSIGDYVDFTFGNNINLAGGNYWIVLERSGALDGSNYYLIQYFPKSGNNTYYNNGSWVLDNPNYSLNFSMFTQGYYKTDASNSSKINFIGFATNTVSTGGNVIVDTAGVSITQTGLTTGSDYYLSNTPGAISTTPGTNIKYVGTATSATSIAIRHNGLKGTTGTTVGTAGGAAGLPSTPLGYITTSVNNLTVKIPYYNT